MCCTAVRCSHLHSKMYSLQHCTAQHHAILPLSVLRFAVLYYSAAALRLGGGGLSCGLACSSYVATSYYVVLFQMYIDTSAKQCG